MDRWIKKVDCLEVSSFRVECNVVEKSVSIDLSTSRCSGDDDHSIGICQW